MIVRDLLLQYRNNYSIYMAHFLFLSLQLHSLYLLATETKYEQSPRFNKDKQFWLEKLENFENNTLFEKTKQRWTSQPNLVMRPRAKRPTMMYAHSLRKPSRDSLATGGRSARWQHLHMWTLRAPQATRSHCCNRVRRLQNSLMMYCFANSQAAFHGRNCMTRSQSQPIKGAP